MIFYPEGAHPAHPLYASNARAVASAQPPSQRPPPPQTRFSLPPPHRPLHRLRLRLHLSISGPPLQREGTYNHLIFSKLWIYTGCGGLVDRASTPHAVGTWFEYGQCRRDQSLIIGSYRLMPLARRSALKELKQQLNTSIKGDEAWR